MDAMASQITEVSYKRLAKRTKIYEFAQDRYIILHLCPQQFPIFYVKQFMR